MSKAAKIISWNVNGIRAVMKKGFLDFVDQEKPDIICLQEIKAKEDQVELAVKGYKTFWNSAVRPGYSGTLIMSKWDVGKVEVGMGIEKHDGEGRVLTVEFPGCFVTTVYTPNSQRELTRHSYRTKEWDADFLAFVKKKEEIKPVIFCGDLNVAHKEIDLANPKTNKKNAGFTPEERQSFDKICASGFVDTFRQYQAEGGHYTWWSNRSGARERNIGWRIDYFVISEALKPKLLGSDILPGVMGSDHCPIRLKMDQGLFRA